MEKTKQKPKNERGLYRQEVLQGNTPGDIIKIYLYPLTDQIYHYSHIYAFPKKYTRMSLSPPH